MEAISKSNRETNSEFDILKSDPVITYDHMSESARSRYFSIKKSMNSSKQLHFFLEELLIAGLTVLAFFTCI